MEEIDSYIEVNQHCIDMIGNYDLVGTINMMEQIRMAQIKKHRIEVIDNILSDEPADDSNKG